MTQCSIYVIPGADRKRYDLAYRCPNETAFGLDVCEDHSTLDGVKLYPRDDGRTYAWDPSADHDDDANQTAFDVVRKATEGK